MKESNFQAFRNGDAQNYIVEDDNTSLLMHKNKKTNLESLKENQLCGIIRYLEPKGGLNLMLENKFIKDSLYVGKTTENTKEFVLEKIYLPLIIKNGIEKIISLEKYANILFGEIIEPFVSDFYNQNFSKLDYVDLYNNNKNSVLSFMCSRISPDSCKERITEMLRYVAFVMLIQWISSDKLMESIESIKLTDKLINKLTDKSVKSIYENILKQPTESWTNYGKNIMINYLENSSVADDIKNFFYRFNHRGSNYWVYIFANDLCNLLEKKFPEEATNEAKEKKIVCVLLKFITSRLVHLKKPSKKYCERAVYCLISSFFLGNDGRFLINPKDFASYLNETGDLEQLLFNPKIDFINLFNLLPHDSHDYSNEYRKYLKTESSKAYFDKMLILVDRRRSKCKKTTTFMKYYTWEKWFACAKDFFKTNFDACCKKRRSKLSLNLNISLNQNENIPLLDNNQKNNHEHQK